jgi:hypothetical protein
MIDSQFLARQHQTDLLDTATRLRMARHVRHSSPAGLRSRAGWWMVQTGIRLVLTDVPQAHAQ